MRSESAVHAPRDRDAAEPSDAIAALRIAGEHPLMYSFPQGAVFAFDRDLRFLSAGGLGLADVGLSREMLEGNTIFEVFPEETASAIEPFYRAALEGGSTTWDVPFDGRIYAQRLAPVPNAAGVIVAGLGFTQDVTQERAAEAALRESEQRHHLTFKHASIGMAIVKLDGTWRQVNASLVNLLGYGEERLLSMTFQDITHPDDLNLDLDYLARLLAGEISDYQMEKRYFTADSRTVWVLLSVSLVRDEGGAPLYFIAQIQDITASKREHQALQDLTAMLAHDLRNPAAVILGFSEELLDASGSECEEVRDFATRIHNSARAMTNLLDNALTSAALDAGSAVSTPRPVEMLGAIDSVVRLGNFALVRVDVTAVDDLEVWVDPVNLHQILENLLTNAFKYGADRVTISACSHGGRVHITVADNGPGVDADFVPHLFDRFSRSPSARTGSQRGNGLGLYIVRDLVTANSGTITYAPAPSGGAEFTVELPLSEAVELEAG